MANKIGLIAGNGRFPFLVADEIKKNGEETIVIGLNEETDREIEAHAGKIFWLPARPVPEDHRYFQIGERYYGHHGRAGKTLTAFCEPET